MTRHFDRAIQPISASLNASDNNFAQTKKLLLALGMDQDVINEMRVDDLVAYSTAPQITATSSYTKTDINGNTIYLPEETALREAAVLNSETVYSTNETGNFIDEYMRIVIVVSYMEGDEYFFSGTATWLTMPYFRGNDSFGVSAKGITVDMSSQYGYYSYTSQIDELDSENTHTDFLSSDFDLLRNNNWEGLGVIFDLPDNYELSGGSEMRRTDFRVHCQFNANIAVPQQELYFNALAAYDHITTNLVISPSLSIDMNGLISFSAGLSLESQHTVREAVTANPIHYIP